MRKAGATTLEDVGFCNTELIRRREKEAKPLSGIEGKPGLGRGSWVTRILVEISVRIWDKCRSRSDIKWNKVYKLVLI